MQAKQKPSNITRRPLRSHAQVMSYNIDMMAKQLVYVPTLEDISSGSRKKRLSYADLNKQLLEIYHEVHSNGAISNHGYMDLIVTPLQAVLLALNKLYNTVIDDMCRYWGGRFVPAVKALYIIARICWRVEYIDNASVSGGKPAKYSMEYADEMLDELTRELDIVAAQC